MRLLHSLVFLISTGKNHTSAFMSFALEWKKDHKRNSKTHCGRIPLRPFCSPHTECGSSAPRPPQTRCAITHWHLGGKLSQSRLC